VAREEYKSQLSALRDSISEDQKQRHQNIARIANELQVSINTHPSPHYPRTPNFAQMFKHQPDPLELPFTNVIETS
jgi:hypothetical protein